MSFLLQYFDIMEGRGEASVCCPFPHRTASGLEYNESNASASVNTDKKVFHCMSCGRGYSEAQFIEHLLECSYVDAKRLQQSANQLNDKYLVEWDNLPLTEQAVELAANLGISESTLKELNVKELPGLTLAFPVTMHGSFLDVRRYNPDCKPKVMSETGSKAGLIIPYDLWRESPQTKVTIVCAGEKDMAVTRSHDLNAITITGGEQSLPIILNGFHNRTIAICYDNDDTGIKGARKLGAYILQKVPTCRVKIVTGFHEVCCENKEDLTDFFVKYQKTKADLVEYIKNTDYFVPSEEDLFKDYPICTMLEAMQPDKAGRMCRSNIQVLATAEQIYEIPKAIMAEKFQAKGGRDLMMVGETRDWELSDNNCQDIINLIDNPMVNKKDSYTEQVKNILKIPPKEPYVAVRELAKATVYKCTITDLYETSEVDAKPVECIAYSINKKLESGGKYLISYKTVKNFYLKGAYTIIITDAVQANDSVSDFHVTDEVRKNLSVIKDLPFSVEEKINFLAERVKGLLGYDGNTTLIKALDLSYHTVLQFNLGANTGVRGYLDSIIVGESRMGKSSTAEALRKAYGLGTIVSLAGSAATTGGLTGGSHKIGDSYQTRAGVIPQNHKGLIVFEEFGKSNSNFIKELTDIRSSNRVRLSRVAGYTELPALVRMIALTNVKSTGKFIRPIADYPDGISIITELVDTAEDIARYDMIVILSDWGTKSIDLTWTPEEPLPEEVYKTRVRWVWSRTADQVIIEPEVVDHIVNWANTLNEAYSCHIKIFGTEAWKKIARLAIAVAGYTVSTDESFENIVVTKECVDYAAAFLQQLYDNPTFKLKEYVEEERKYNEIDDDGVANIQDLFIKFPGLIMCLERCSTTTKSMLEASSGLNRDDMNGALSRLIKGCFIKLGPNEIMPTGRFRKGISRIQRTTAVPRVGEQ